MNFYLLTFYKSEYNFLPSIVNIENRGLKRFGG